MDTPDLTDEQPRVSSAKLRQQVEANDIKWLMSSKQGRRVARRVLDHAGLYRSSFTGNSETFFREGQRDVGLFLLTLINTHSPESYPLLLTESRSQ